jgi:hypothetical protein
MENEQQWSESKRKGLKENEQKERNEKEKESRFTPKRKRIEGE